MHNWGELLHNIYGRSNEIIVIALGSFGYQLGCVGHDAVDGGGVILFFLSFRQWFVTASNSEMLSEMDRFT